jgi:small subunit ribosomal protein S6
LRDYEGLFILKPDLGKEELGILYTKIQENIKKYKGAVELAQEQGKKLLGCKINKQKEGLYYLLRFKAEPSSIVNLKSDFKLNESILRVMFIKPLKSQGVKPHGQL